VVFVLILGLSLAWYLNTRSLEKKISELQKTVDTQDSLIVDLEQELESTRFEVQVVQRGLAALEDFNARQKEIRDDEDRTKTKILETVTQSDEAKDWWSSDIPTDLLDALMCQ
jgi:uncharacterized coiled-coil protein SlyX